MEIDADIGELAGAESTRYLFVARKAIGYLFHQPIAATSFLLSLLRQTPSGTEIRDDLEALLFEPLLINFSGSVGEYLREKAESEEEPTKPVIGMALSRLERYIEGLESVGEISALDPGQKHREAYRRHIAEVMAQSWKRAEAESVVLQVFPKSVLLYGRKAIHHVFGPEGRIQRMETKLGSHRAQVEVSRYTYLDPVGLERMLRVFRGERMSS
jgi:hypothetical protein